MAPSGTQTATRFGKTDPPKIDMAPIGAKLAGCGKIRIDTPIRIRQRAIAPGKYLSFMASLLKLPDNFVAILSNVGASPNAGFFTVNVKCPVFRSVADTAVNCCYKIS